MQRAESAEVASGAAGASSAPAMLAAAAASTPPPHLRLHQHALESIFGSLSFQELRCALLVSHRWLAAVCSMRSLAHGKKFLRGLNFSAATPASALARHVGVLTMGKLPLTLAQLQQICSCMLFLRELWFEIQPSREGNWSDLLLPPSLLRLHVSCEKVSGITVAQLIAAVSTHQQLEELHLTEPRQLHRLVETGAVRVSFAPLRAMSSLKQLYLRGSTWPTAAQIKDLRALVQLEELAIPECSEEQLLQLLEPQSNSQLQWTQLPSRTSDSLTDAVVALLPALPRLSSFEICILSAGLTNFNFLSQLPALTSVSLMAGSSDASHQRLDAMLLALSTPMPRITSFHCDRSDLASPQLAALLALMPNLQRLVLLSLSNLDSLSFLISLRTTLRFFRLQQCSHPKLTPAVLLEGLHGLLLTEFESLHSLMLHEQQLAALTPPSILLPTLSSFKYRTHSR